MKYALLPLLIGLALVEGSEKELAFGRMLAADLRRGSPPIEDARISNYLARLADRLNQNAQSPFPLVIDVTRDLVQRRVSGLPGGILRVPLGSIIGAATEADLAFALGNR